MSRVEKKRRELELAVEKLNRDHEAAMSEDAQLVRKNLDYLEEILGNGVEDLSEDTIEKLEGWLPRC
jgi:hypothetical protein